MADPPPAPRAAASASIPTASAAVAPPKPAATIEGAPTQGSLAPSGHEGVGDAPRRRGAQKGPAPSSWNATSDEVVAEVTKSAGTRNRRLTVSEELALLEEATKKQAKAML